MDALKKVVYLLISVEHGKLKLVSKALLNFPEVQDLSEVYGRFDIIVRGAFDDEQHLKDFYQNKLVLVSGIRRTETLIALPEDVDETEARASESTEEAEQTNEESDFDL